MKKSLIFVILILVGTSGLVGGSLVGDDGVCVGDVDHNGVINVMDVFRITFSAGLFGCNINNGWCDGYDVNKDGKVCPTTKWSNLVWCSSGGEDEAEVKRILGNNKELDCDPDFCEVVRSCDDYTYLVSCNRDECSFGGCSWVNDKCIACNEVMSCNIFSSSEECNNQKCMSCGWLNDRCWSCSQISSCFSINDFTSSSEECNADVCGLDCVYTSGLLGGLDEKCRPQICTRHQCTSFDENSCFDNKCGFDCGWLSERSECVECPTPKSCSDFSPNLDPTIQYNPDVVDLDLPDIKSGCLGNLIIEGCNVPRFHCIWDDNKYTCTSTDVVDCTQSTQTQCLDNSISGLNCAWDGINCIDCSLTVCSNYGQSDCENVNLCGLSCSWDGQFCINNIHPVLKQVAQQVIKEGEKLEFELHATDLDSDAITFSLVDMPLGASLIDNKFVWQTTPQDIGNHFLSFTVTDTKGGDDTKSVIVSVVPENIEQPEQILIIVNNDYPDENSNGIKDSIEVGEYYRSKRNIPEDNVCHVNFGTSYYGLPNGDDVTITIDKYLAQIRPQILNCLEKEVNGIKLKNKILYVVMTYGVPLKIIFPDDYNLCNDGEQRLRSINNVLAFDSAVSNIFGLLPFNKNGAQTTCADGTLLVIQRGILYHESAARLIQQGFLPTQYYSGAIEKFDNRYLIYLVTRIDGPNIEYAKGLVDKALYAEKYLSIQSGKAYLRSNTPSFESSIGYDEAGNQIRYGNKLTIARDYLISAGFQTVYKIVPWDDGKNMHFEDLEDALFLWSWYYPEYYDITKGYFRVGSFGMDIDSYSLLENLGFKNSGPLDRWCEGLIKDGITATMCAITEPQLGGLPFVDKFFKHFLGGYNFAESSYYSQSQSIGPLGVVVFIGDPLFKIPSTAEVDTTKPQISNINSEIIKGIDLYLAEISWDTDEVSRSSVEIGRKSSIYNSIINDEWMMVEHKVLVSGLLPGATYYYKVSSTDPAGNTVISEENFFQVPVEIPKQQLLFYGKFEDNLDTNSVENKQDTRRNGFLMNNLNTNAVSSEVGFSGRSFLLDSSIENINIPIDGNINSQAGSIEFYFKPLPELKKGEIIFESNNRFGAYWWNTVCTKYGCSENSLNKGRIVFRVGGVREVITGNLDLSEDRFYHLRFVWRENPVIREVYLDGLLVGKNNIMPWYQLGDIGTNLYLHKGAKGSDAYYDELKIYDDVSEQDINSVSAFIRDQCLEDVNGDNKIDVLDLIITKNNLGKMIDATNIAADVNRDDIINILDMTLIRDKLGVVCPVKSISLTGDVIMGPSGYNNYVWAGLIFVIIIVVFIILFVLKRKKTYKLRLKHLNKRK